QYAHRDHLCIPCSKIEQGIQSRGSKFDENYSLRWVSSAWTSTYKSDGGRIRAAADAMKASKTRLAKPLARTISGLTDPERRFPKHIERLFAVIGENHGIHKLAVEAEVEEQ
ncbi:hypothetical protein KTE50_31280, partial [Burkholderia multivorans]|nr:hypothetical protein [Burkholderia multivorans]